MVDPGPHEIHLRIDWTRSPTRSLQLKPGERATFACGPNASLLTTLYYITAGRDRYIRLERLEGGASRDP